MPPYQSPISGLYIEGWKGGCGGNAAATFDSVLPFLAPDFDDDDEDDEEEEDVLLDRFFFFFFAFLFKTLSSELIESMLGDRFPSEVNRSVRMTFPSRAFCTLSCLFFNSPSCAFLYLDNNLSRKSRGGFSVAFLSLRSLTEGTSLFFI